MPPHELHVNVIELLSLRPFMNEVRRSGCERSNIATLVRGANGSTCSVLTFKGGGRGANSDWKGTSVLMADKLNGQDN